MGLREIGFANDIEGIPTLLLGAIRNRTVLDRNIRQILFAALRRRMRAKSAMGHEFWATYINAMNTLDYKSAKPDEPPPNEKTDPVLAALWCGVIAACFGVGSCIFINSPIFVLPGFLLLGCWLCGGVGAVWAIVGLFSRKKNASVLTLVGCLGVIFLTTIVFNHLDRPWSGLH